MVERRQGGLWNFHCQEKKNHLMMANDDFDDACRKGNFVVRQTDVRVSHKSFNFVVVVDVSFSLLVTG